MKLKPIYFLLFSLLVIVSCGEETKTKATPAVAKKDTTEESKKTSIKKQEKKSYPKLNKKNYKQFLTEYGKQEKRNIVEVSSSFGTIKIRLYENAPLHRANFLYLTERKYFDDTQFYRVSKNFVCQAGNSDEMEAQYHRTDIGHYNVDREMNNGNCHKYGAVAMAKIYENNPDKVSSAFEWYIVLGEKYNRATLRALEREHNIKFTEEQKEFYSTIGGTPYLDHEHTVFGEVIEGMDVVKEINKVNTDGREWPLTNIPIKAKILD